MDSPIPVSSDVIYSLLSFNRRPFWYDLISCCSDGFTSCCHLARCDLARCDLGVLGKTTSCVFVEAGSLGLIE